MAACAPSRTTWRFTAGQLVIVDEASLADTRTLATLVQLADQADAKDRAGRRPPAARGRRRRRGVRDARPPRPDRRADHPAPVQPALGGPRLPRAAPRPTRTPWTPTPRTARSPTGTCDVVIDKALDAADTAAADRDGSRCCRPRTCAPSASSTPAPTNAPSCTGHAHGRRRHPARRADRRRRRPHPDPPQRPAPTHHRRVRAQRRPVARHRHRPRRGPARAPRNDGTGHSTITTRRLTSTQRRDGAPARRLRRRARRARLRRHHRPLPGPDRRRVPHHRHPRHGPRGPLRRPDPRPRPQPPVRRDRPGRRRLPTTRRRHPRPRPRRPRGPEPDPGHPPRRALRHRDLDHLPPPGPRARPPTRTTERPVPPLHRTARRRRPPGPTPTFTHTPPTPSPGYGRDAIGR